MNKLLNAASAVVGANAFAGNPLFLQSEPQTLVETEPIRASSTTACQFVNDYTYYNYLDTTNSNTAFEISNTKGSATAYFTYCQELQNTNANECSNSYYASVYVNGQCTLNTNSISGTSMTVNDEQVFTLQYTQSSSTDGDGTYQLNVHQQCESGLMPPQTVGSLTSESTSNGEVYYATQKSNLGCGVFTANALIQFVDEYKWFFGIGFIVLGVFFGMMGLKLFNVALFLVGTIAVAGLLLFIFYASFMKDNTKEWVSWTVLSLAVLLGLISGFLLVKLDKFAGAILAAWGGFLLGVLINETVMWLAGSAVLFWIINIVMALIFFAIGYKFFDQAVMISTSFIGSYMMMKGVGIMAGGFPNIYVLIKMIEDNAISSIDPVFYAYLVGIVVLTILTSIFQFKVWYKKREAEEHPYARLS